jgi:hypothetical protein
MGHVKGQLEEDWERGWRGGGDKTVCAVHLEDEVLLALVESEARETRCS